jgi:nitrogen PTS system EIIA component
MLLTAGSAAKLLGTSERQIYRWVDDNEIPCRRVRDQLRFNRTDLLEWATARRMPVHAEAFVEDDASDQPPRLSDALRAGEVSEHLRGADREAVVLELVDRVLPPDIDRELFIEVLLARELAGLTTIGDGLAIPQVRNPIVVAAVAPRVAICHLETPLPLGAADGLPVSTIFVAVSPTIRSHLQLVARVLRAIADHAFKAAVLRHAPLAELITEATRIEAELPQLAESDEDSE